MDKEREPGIRLTGVVVERIRFDDLPAGANRPKELEYKFRIERRHGHDELSAEAVIHLAMRAADGVQSPFSLELSVAGRFEADAVSPNMRMQDYMRWNGPAAVMPFVREVVVNITARSRHGPVFLPAVNVVALVRREEEEAKRDEPVADR